MSKPLSIEELKALQVGDWVWIDFGEDYIGKYCRKVDNSRDNEFIYDTIWDCRGEVLAYSNYGKTWTAYKNKEQAESKGEWVELPCIAMVEQGLVDGKFKPTKEAQQLNGRYAVVYIDKSKYSKPLIDICWSKDGYYKYEQAERRLAELKGD